MKPSALFAGLCSQESRNVVFTNGDSEKPRWPILRRIDQLKENDITTKKTLSIAVGTALGASLAFSPLASADTNPFGMTELSGGYMQVAGGHGEGKCGEGKCGGEKHSEGSCGEGKCGEGKCGGEKTSEGSCGEGKCGSAG